MFKEIRMKSTLLSILHFCAVYQITTFDKLDVITQYTVQTLTIRGSDFVHLYAILPFHWNGIACLFMRAANEIVNFSTSEHYEDVIKNSEC